MEWRLMVLLFMGVCACQSSTEYGPDGEQKEFITDAPATTDSVVALYPAFTIEETQLLERYFEPGLLAKIDQYVQAYNSLATAEDFEKNYNQGMALFSDLYEALTVPKTAYLSDRWKTLETENEYVYAVDLLDEYEKLNGIIGPIIISCAAECTDLDFVFDLEALHEKAKSTKGNADEDFMDLVMHIEASTMGYAAYPGFKVWFVQTWDYGGYSMLGNGVFTDAVKRVEKFEKEHALFAAQILAMREDFINSLTWDGSFGLSKDEVLKEFDALLKMNYFTPEEKEKMREGREKIQTEAEGYQFNCETGDCSYG